MIHRWLVVIAGAYLFFGCVESEHSGNETAPPPSTVAERLELAFQRVCFAEQRCAGADEDMATRYCGLFSLAQHDFGLEPNECNYASMKVLECLGSTMESACMVGEGSCADVLKDGVDVCGSGDKLMPKLSVEFPSELANFTQEACIVSARCGNSLSFSCDDLRIAQYWIYNQSLPCVNALTSYLTCIGEISSCDDSPCFLLERSMHEACGN